MDKKQQTSPELSQAELLPTQEEQVPANLLSRKRQLDSDDDEDAKPQTKRAPATTRRTSEPARLTRKNLALFDRMPNSKKTSTHRDFDDSSTTKTLSTTASGFAIQARENGILDPLESKPPKNLEDIRRRLDESRGTASPTESVYDRYVHTVGDAPNEATMVGEMLPLLKQYPNSYRRALKQAFTGFPRDIGFNNGLLAPQPDYVEGLGMEEYRPLPVDRYVNGAALYKDNPRSVTLPHLAGEWKGPGGDMKDATLQSGYDGAALVYARNQALSYQGKSDPPGHASITTFTTNGTRINFYAHYAAPAPAGDGTLEYHQFPIKSTNLVNSYGEYKEGRKHLRSEQDHAKKQSQALRDQLKEHYRQQQQQQPSSGLHPIAEGVPPPPQPVPACTEPLDMYEDEEGDY